MAVAQDGGRSAFNAVGSQRRIGRPGSPACTWRSGAPDTHDTDRDPVLLGDRVSCCIDYDLPGLKTEDGIATFGFDRVAWFRDPDGNLLALTQEGDGGRTS